MARLSQPITPARIERAARKLGPLERDILMLSAREKLGRDEIAARLDLTPEQVDRLLAEALVKLHRALERQERPWWKLW
ncbi:MAG TPA: sigma factor-like helix-turn-helix DNA-binding protein [Allosphingosinicella sp.]|nr:sigma factor-like helix-turn-helix DNA-binding protein [Allosphingosinicella sp.]